MKLIQKKQHAELDMYETKREQILVTQMGLDGLAGRSMIDQTVQNRFPLLER